ncbi:unnamed protein product [Rhizoctonia solani]|uniref:Amine oxidase domain-containing protein n=1 Tax=Rhizoctonia solani TaxID=456999 RepID=A0A8H3CVW7_9AGAM|nr:unnamed protein product [Rhizoctonia solani]
MTVLVNLEARSARRHYVETHMKIRQGLVASPSGPGPMLPDSTPASKTSPIDTRPIKKVAIVGGGVAGLRAAMILGKSFPVDIYESGKEVGGRLYTHHFEKGGKWDYFDVGAMRFPNTALMEPTFDLFNELNLPLLDYKISDDNNIRAFNLQRHTVAELKVRTYAEDPFQVGKNNGGTVPMNYATQDPGKLLRQALEPLITGLVNDIKNHTTTGMEALMKQDHHSARSYLREEHNYEPPLIDYIETMSFGTGWFDRALAETVFEELCFEYDKGDAEKLEWHCVEGGSYQIIEKMKEKLKAPEYQDRVTIKTKHRVTSAVFKEDASPEELMLTVSGLIWEETGSSRVSHFSEKYSHVLFALPPPCLRTIDLSTCRLDYEQRNALRNVSVGPSCKIGIKFKTAWWTRPEINIHGGQSTTDRMARTIVYPSYGNGECTALIASYSWTQDAVALGSWIQEHDIPAKQRLKELILEDLAYVHKGQISLEELHCEFEDMFPWDWTNHPDSMGAFGIFGPDQYSQFFCALTRPAAGGHMHFVGETISTIHGWVAGALESATRGVKQMLELHSMALAEKKSVQPPPKALLHANGFTRAKSLFTSNSSPSVAVRSVNNTLGSARADVAETFDEREVNGKEEAHIHKSDTDPLKLFLKNWNPDVGVAPELFTKQLAISRSLQVKEFGLSPAFEAI